MESKICLAFDRMSGARAIEISRRLQNRFFAGKIHALYDRHGAFFVRELKRYMPRVWVDHKIHDTPDSAAERVAALIDNGADIVTAHALGGQPMLSQVVRAAEAANPKAEIWVVTLLTSLEEREIMRTYVGDSPEQIVHRLAWEAKESGAHGIVCSGQEVGLLSRTPGFTGMRLVVPGIRLPGSELGQQKRHATPREALSRGATLIVPGKEVTGTRDLIAAFEAVEAQVRGPLPPK